MGKMVKVMSEILIELIGIIVEALIDTAVNNTRGDKNRIEDNSIHKEIQKQKTYSNIYEGPDYSMPIVGINPIVHDNSKSKENQEKKKPTLKPKITIEKKPRNTQVNQVKLEILLLSYMFKEDDGRISSKEKRAIKKHFSKFKGVLSEDDIKEIKQFESMDKSLINIRAFINQNQVTEGDISDSIRTLKEVERGSNRYSSVISRIESSLLEAMGY